MASWSKIEWTDHTFNPWVGCTKVSPACDHCYAEGWAKRTGHPELWRGERRRTSPSYWRQTHKWNHQAKHEGVRRRVFCASLADVFDNQVPIEWREDLFDLIQMTPNLDWLLLTKRPQNMRTMLRPNFNQRGNVWLGATVENQEEFRRRAGRLLDVEASVHFLSCEPLLGPLDLEGIPVEWVIAGGESGHGARPMEPQWARSLRDQCKATKTAFFFKQWGEFFPDDPAPDAHTAMRRVGKKRAGRLLDGREHNEFPQVLP